jgi:AraC-like DNA-binding protein
MNAILILIIVIQLTLFSLFLFSRKSSNKVSHFLLGSFFLCLAINLFNIYCFYSKELFYNYTHLLLIGAPFAFLYTPLFYFYVKSLTDEKFKLGIKDLYHIIPFTVFTLYLMIVFYFNSSQYKIEYIMTTGRQLPIVLLPVLNVQIIIYTIIIIKLIINYRARIKNIYSAIEKINYSWLVFIAYGFIMLWLADIVRFFTFLLKPYQLQLVESFFFTGFLLLSYLILYKALTQPEIFRTDIDFPQKKKKSLSDPVNQQYLNQLLSFMESEKPFLNSSLTLFDLSEKISIPTRSISEVINNSLNQNFYDFINSYRIKEAQKLLEESSQSNKTILEILYEAGFGTKSSFNQAFKKHTGKTPSQFKRQKVLAG